MPDTSSFLWDSSDGLVIAVDTLVEGVHFRSEAAAADVAWKALAVNLSDLAAMGARPKTAAVALQWPLSNQVWLKAFRRGLKLASDAFSVEIIAASLIEGPGIVTVEVFGAVPDSLALTRHGARAGDAIYVTGTLGDAGLGLEVTRGGMSLSNADSDYLVARLDRPTPRIATGLLLRGIASAAIDVSDGLAGDLGHILSASGVGARIEIEKLPCSPQLEKCLTPDQAQRLAASAGDDYELCFTVSGGQQEKLESIRERLEVDVTQVGVIEERPGLRFVLGNGDIVDPGHAFDHFA